MIAYIFLTNFKTKFELRKVPFKEIMKNCQIALSGFVNPERSCIRDQGICFKEKY